MLIEWTCPLLSESCRSSGSKAKVFANQRAFWALVPSSCNLLSTCLFVKLVMSFTEGLQCIFAFLSSFLMYFTMLSFVSFITFISSFALILCRSLSSFISRYNVSFSFSRFSNFASTLQCHNSNVLFCPLVPGLFSVISCFLLPNHPQS